MTESARESKGLLAPAMKSFSSGTDSMTAIHGVRMGGNGANGVNNSSWSSSGPIAPGSELN